MKKFIGPLIAATGLVLMLTGCESALEKCRSLPAPNSSEIAASNSGAEVERTWNEGKSNARDCVLENGRWVPED